MWILKIQQDNKVTEISFEGETRLSELLQRAGYSYGQPCGGRGTCGKCAVKLAGAVSEPNEAEQRAGARLSCQAVVLGDAQVELPATSLMSQIEMGGEVKTEGFEPMPGRYGAAIDIGTTTIAMKLYDLSCGKCVGQAAEVNPQTAVAADVMGRIEAAMSGRLDLLQRQIKEALEAMLEDICREIGLPVEVVDILVVSGNTTMLYLLTGRNPESLSHAPFQADYLYDEEMELWGKRTYLPPCVNAFVGADITCAVLNSEMCEGDEIALLCDIGTNGEIALWKEGVLYVTSAAAGPAFEGAGISQGCGSVKGAIDKVWSEGDTIKIHTIDDAAPVGICGSGLIDGIAELLALEEIDETGAMEREACVLREPIAICREDVRAVQLAKAAIAAGIETLLETAGVCAEDVHTFYLAGGFGSHLDVHNAVKIGLIPEELEHKVKVIGNAALSGAAQLLLCKDGAARAREIARCSKHVSLGGNPVFNEKYINKMFFDGESE